MAEEAAQKASTYSVEGIGLVFFRAIALIILIMGIRYWGMLVGFNDENFRFDTMSNHWRVAATTLSVLMPVAALGLWAMERWGFAIWGIAVVMEVFMHFVKPDLYGGANLVLIFHASCVLVFIVYWAVKVVEEKRAGL